MDRLPSSGRERVAATGRMVVGLGKAGVQRLVRRSDDDERALGELLAGELDRMKGLAMKVGQVLSYVDVGLPEETRAVLERLQRGAEPLAPERVIPLVEAELGAPVGELFDRFDPDPVASASIGQVHRASFRGREVAVKVRYPGVREVLEADTRHLDTLSKVASALTSVDGPALVRELRERVLEECDYGLEAEHQRTFARILASDPVLVVPELVPERCAEGVLTSAWWEGVSLTKGHELPLEDREPVAVALVRLLWESLFGHGILHSDPHPGNFLVTEDRRLVVLDYGSVKRFAPDRVEAVRELLRVAIEGRRAEVVDAARAAGLVPEPDRIDPDELWTMFQFLVAPYRVEGFTFGRDWWREELRRIKRPTSTLRHLAVPPDWLWIQRTLVGVHAVLLGLGASAPLAPVAERALSLPLDPA